MRELIGQLSVVDDDAASALRVIAHFDGLVENRGSLSALVRAAAALSGMPAGLRDPAQSRAVRAAPDGADLPECHVDAAWPRQVVDVEQGTVVWVETTEHPSPILALVLERFAGAARVALDRTRHRLTYAEAVRVAVDVDSDEQSRAAALRRLSVTAPATVFTLAGALGDVTGVPARLIATIDGDRVCVMPASVDLPPLPDGVRVGVAEAPGSDDLPLAWSRARLALRFARPRGRYGSVVRFEDLGAIATVAAAVPPGVAAGDPDVQRLRRASDDYPWAVDTLEAVVATASMRQAAERLHVHHSTLQERVAHLQVVLSYSPCSPTGRHRAAMTLLLDALV